MSYKSIKTIVEYLLKPLMKRIWFNMRPLCNGKFIIQTVIHTLIIVAFFHALDFFSKKADIDIDNGTQRYGSLIEDMRKFYNQNKLKIPDALKELLKAEKVETEPFITSNSPHIDLLKILEKSERDPIINIKMEELQKQFSSDVPIDYVLGGYISGSCLPESDITEILEKVKSRLTSKQRYIFLMAAMYSRQYLNRLSIRNSGDVDLNDIRVVIHSPLGIITGGRDNRLTELILDDQSVKEISKESDKWIINIPYLSPDASHSLHILSREYPINEKETESQYKPQPDFDKKKIVFWVIITSLGLIFLQFILPESNERTRAS